MKKNWLKVVSLLVTLALLLSVTVAFADNYDNYLFPYRYSATVIATRVSVRSGPSVRSSSYGQLKNGQTFMIVGRYNDWYIVDLDSCKFSRDSSGYGFLQASFVKENPSWIVVPGSTFLYATPWQQPDGIQHKNGQQSNRVYLVIEQQPPFYAVQLCENSPGTAFIYMNDVPRYSYEGQDLYVCVEDKVPMYDAPWGNKRSSVSRFTVVNVIENYDGFYEVVVNYGTANEYTGWVQEQYFQKVIN